MGYIVKEFTCENYNLIAKGVDLGYNHNNVCDMISKNGIYGEDGCGYTTVHHSKAGECTYDEDMTKIIDALLDEENLSELKIIDD